MIRVPTLGRTAASTEAAIEPSHRHRLVVHDFAGHPFQVQLSRALAERGHTVLHLHCASDVTAKGAVQRAAGDPDRFRVEGIRLRKTFEKYRVDRRLSQELTYGRAVARHIRRFAPEAVLSSNTPLFAQEWIRRDAQRRGTRFIFWQQDVLSRAMSRFCADRAPFGGRALAAGFTSLERRIARKSDAVVPISSDFLPLLSGWGVREERISVIENWAPLDEIPMHPHDNAWSEEHGLAGLRTFLYAGTLGMKHNPEFLLKLAERFSTVNDVRVVVVSQGRGADWIRSEALRRSAANLIVLPYQPYDRLPEVLASGDVLVALLDSDAGGFSVPSKILTYHCAGRVMLAAIPEANLGSRVIQRAGSGLVVEPADIVGFLAGAERLISDQGARQTAGIAARAYAQEAFDLQGVAQRFERAIAAAMQSSSVARLVSAQ